MKLMTILGTRPEIIRLACIIPKLDIYCEHILVHTGQNYDYNLNDIFFDQIGLRKPDYTLDVKSDTLHGQISNIIFQTGELMIKLKPDAVFVLGDTNSSLSVINAKRLKIPIFHMEAGDRSFDEDVPEESNRRIVDHIADINMAYTECSRRNLLNEGFHPAKIFVIGSPLREVYHSLLSKFRNSTILTDLGLQKSKYFTASLHREENIDNNQSLALLIKCLNNIAVKYDFPIIVSTHPRTKNRIGQLNLEKLCHKHILWHEPFGLIDYITLQQNSFCVVSDSGSIHEDSAILNFPAIAIRKSTEKQESIESGHCVLTGLDPETVLTAIQIATIDPVNPYVSPMPSGYSPLNVSSKIVRIILGMTNLTSQKLCK